MVGRYKNEWSEILDLEIEGQEIYMHKGLKKHIEQRHPDCLEYLDLLPDIINNPDYIGINPQERPNESIELIKQYDSNILIGIKVDIKNDYLYVATLHELNEYKIKQRLYSGRLKNGVEMLTFRTNKCILKPTNAYYVFRIDEVGNGSRHPSYEVSEMQDTPPCHQSTKRCFRKKVSFFHAIKFKNNPHPLTFSSIHVKIPL